MSHVVLILYIKESRIPRQGSDLKKFYERSYIVISSDLRNADRKITDKFSFYWTLNFQLARSVTAVLSDT